jgi:glycosyltransferase involved in cell wall biosynthesis
MVSVSAVLNTLNEEQNIAHAIGSVRHWVQEIIVFDMSSDDRTVEIARSLGAQVSNFPRMINFDAARVAAVAAATKDWILLLDADEMVPRPLSRQLLDLAAQNSVDVCLVPRLNYFSGEQLLHAGWGPEQDRTIRFYRKGMAVLNDTLHAHIEIVPGARVHSTRYSPGCAVVHFNYKDSVQFVAKLNKYTSLTAWQRRDSRNWKDRSLFFAPAAEFLRRYIRLEGFRSGAAGFYFSFMMAAYRMTLSFKLREIQSHCTAEGSTVRYEEIASGIIAEYESAGKRPQPDSLGGGGNHDVDFVVNTFERTYRSVLAPGFLKAMSEEHCFPFRRRVVLINNVEDRAQAEKMAQALRESGEITEFHFVSDLLEKSLQGAGLTHQDIEPNVHYTDCSLVAVFLAGSDYVVYCDADVRLKTPYDWITPSLALLDRDPRIAVANPNWPQPTLAAEAREYSGEFGIGYGFSDQVYMVRRSEFARPIYQFRAPISLRYPMSQRGRIFEQMVDSYMRVNRRLRATCSTVTYEHRGEEAASHPKFTLRTRFSGLRNQVILRSIRLLPGRHPLFHI